MHRPQTTNGCVLVCGSGSGSQWKGDGNDGRSDSNDGNRQKWQLNEEKWWKIAFLHIFSVACLLAYCTVTVLYCARECMVVRAFSIYTFSAQCTPPQPVTGSIYSIFDIHHRETGTYTRSIRIIYAWQNICLALTPRNMALSYMHSHCYCCGSRSYRKAIEWEWE